METTSARAADALAATPSGTEAGDSVDLQELSRCLSHVKEGRLDSLGTIYDRCSGELFGLALWRTGSREDAADVVQEVFAKLARTRAELGHVSDVRAYLMTMTHRLAIDVIRRRRPAEPLEEHPYLEASTGSEQDRLHARLLAAEVDKLPDNQREVVYLRHFQSLSFKEIGRITGVSTFTAASRHRLAMRKLRRLLGVES